STPHDVAPTQSSDPDPAFPQGSPLARLLRDGSGLLRQTQSLKDIHGNRENYRGVFLYSDLSQSLQVAKLDGHRLLGYERCSLSQLFGGQQFPFGMDDLG